MHGRIPSFQIASDVYEESLGTKTASASHGDAKGEDKRNDVCTTRTHSKLQVCNKVDKASMLHEEIVPRASNDFSNNSKRKSHDTKEFECQSQ
ncbi:hypothetical protein Tco_1498767, partial [Tanacetum coccineum]